MRRIDVPFDTKELEERLPHWRVFAHNDNGHAAALEFMSDSYQGAQDFITFDENGTTFVVSGGVKAWGFPPVGMSPATITFSSTDPTAESYPVQHGVIVNDGEMYGFVSDDNNDIIGTVYRTLVVETEEDNELVVFSMTTDDGKVARCVYAVDETHQMKADIARIMLRVFEQLIIVAFANQSYLRSHESTMFAAEVKAVNAYLLAGEGEPLGWVRPLSEDRDWTGWRVMAPYHPESILVDIHRFDNELEYGDIERAFIPLPNNAMPQFGHYARFNIAAPPDHQSFDRISHILVAIDTKLSKVGDTLSLTQADSLEKVDVDGVVVSVISGKDDTEPEVREDGDDTAYPSSYYLYFVDEVSDCAILLSYSTFEEENVLAGEMESIGYSVIRSLREGVVK